MSRGPWPGGRVPLAVTIACSCGERATFTDWPPSAADAAAERAGWRDGRCPHHNLLPAIDTTEESA